MTHEWEDPDLPLNPEAKGLGASGVLASGEGNFFDYRMNINLLYDDAVEGFVLETSGADLAVGEFASGVFVYDGLDGKFSGGTYVPSGLGDRLKPFKRPPLTTNSNKVDTRDPMDFRVQDSFINPVPLNGKKVEILFLSTYGTEIRYDRYGSFDSYFNSEFGLDEE